MTNIEKEFDEKYKYFLIACIENEYFRRYNHDDDEEFGKAIYSKYQEIKDFFLSKMREMTDEMINLIVIDELGDGRLIEDLAKKFAVPDSVMANRLLDIKKDEIIKIRDKWLK